MNRFAKQYQKFGGEAVVHGRLVVEKIIDNLWSDLDPPTRAMLRTPAQRAAFVRGIAKTAMEEFHNHSAREEGMLEWRATWCRRNLQARGESKAETVLTDRLKRISDWLNWPGRRARRDAANQCLMKVLYYQMLTYRALAVPQGAAEEKIAA